MRGLYSGLPCGGRSNSCGRLNISLRTSHSSGYIGCSKLVCGGRKYRNPQTRPFRYRADHP